MGWRLWLSDKTVRKFAELPIYCHRQKCSPGNVVSGSIRFMQIFPGVRWRGGVKWEWGRWKWRFLFLLFTVFRTFYIWYDCQWPWAYFKVIGLFHAKFRLHIPRAWPLNSRSNTSRVGTNVVFSFKTACNSEWYGKSYYRLLIGNHALAFDWCHFRWPWKTFECHFSLVIFTSSISETGGLSRRAVSKQ